ncbi:hypothetical protein LTR53_019587, partial [Teratosphaeriaceae sp. CCFEE 6253]
GERDDDAEADEGPNEARNAGEGPGELLAADGGGVGVDDIAVDPAQHEEHQDEVGEAARVEHLLDQEADAMIIA